MKGFSDLFFGNMGVIITIGFLISWFSPYNVEHGYKINYDVLGLLIFSLVYMVYIWMYTRRKVKGTFMLKLKEPEEV